MAEYPPEVAVAAIAPEVVVVEEGATAEKLQTDDQTEHADQRRCVASWWCKIEPGQSRLHCWSIQVNKAKRKTHRSQRRTRYWTKFMRRRLAEADQKERNMPLKKKKF